MMTRLLNKLYKFIDSVPSQYSINAISDNPNPNPSSEPENEDEIHAIIRKKIEILLTDSGFPNLKVVIGPSKGCQHIYCNIAIDTSWPNIPLDDLAQEQDAFAACAKSAILIAFNEVLGASKMLDESFKFTRRIGNYNNKKD